MRKIVLFLILAPIVDLYILVRASQNIGFWYTILLIILTGIAGYYLARTEGRLVISNINNQLSQGNIPGNELLNGFCILIGGMLLLIPGIVTDVVGITMVLPVSREIYKKYFKRKFLNIINTKNTNIFFRWMK